MDKTFRRLSNAGTAKRFAPGRRRNVFVFRFGVDLVVRSGETFRRRSDFLENIILVSEFQERFAVGGIAKCHFQETFPRGCDPATRRAPAAGPAKRFETFRRVYGANRPGNVSPSLPSAIAETAKPFTPQTETLGRLGHKNVKKRCAFAETFPRPCWSAKRFGVAGWGGNVSASPDGETFHIPAAGETFRRRSNGNVSASGPPR